MRVVRQTLLLLVLGLALVVPAASASDLEFPQVRQDPDFATEVRSIIECVIHDAIDSAIEI